MTEFSKTAGSSQLLEFMANPVEKAAHLLGEGPQNLVAASIEVGPLSIGLVDSYRFSQECLIKAFEGLEPRPLIFPFETIQDCVAGARPDIDLIVYYTHSTDLLEKTIVKDVVGLRLGFATAPIIVLSDAEDAENPKTIRCAVMAGAQGFIPTRITGIPITFAAIRFISAGGVFAPLDLLLTKRPDRVVEGAPQSRLTPRQLGVLGHLRQGKANKTIAHELGMSESTVKVHVRNIMRKMGATNRTQAAYKAQKLRDDSGVKSMVDAGIY